jgi:molecular chaperone GrpE
MMKRVARRQFFSILSSARSASSSSPSSSSSSSSLSSSSSSSCYSSRGRIFVGRDKAALAVASFSNRSNPSSSSSSSVVGVFGNGGGRGVRGGNNNGANYKSVLNDINNNIINNSRSSSRCFSTTSLARRSTSTTTTTGEGNEGDNNDGDKSAGATGSEGEEKEGEQGQEGEEQNEMAEKDALIVELNERHLRTLADMENLRTRTQRQNEDAKKFAVQGFAKDLLDVADNMDRACATVTEEIIAEAKNDAGKLEALLRSFKEGVELTQRQLSSGFKKHGLVKFDPVDEPFDANEHMALFNVPVGETKKEPGSVAVVTKAGYRLHDRVVRAAEVGVYQ